MDLALLKQTISTMADVARACGVSIQTVSAVVNDRPGISEDTRRRIRAVMSELDYQPNQHARTLRGYRNPMIGVIIPSITNPFFPELVRGIEDVARSSGHGLFLCNDDYDDAKILEYFGFIRSNHASGLIASPGLIDRVVGGEIDRQIHAFVRRNVPIVMFGSQHPALPVTSVVVDAKAAVAAAAEHLLSLGHRRIGLITPPAGLLVAEERVTDFRTAFAMLGHPLDPDLIVAGGFDMEAGVEATGRLLALDEPPTAIVASNDLTAMGAIAVIQGRGLRVPHDISVLGYDDIPFARIFQPSITTVAQPIYEMGAAAITAILEPAPTGDRDDRMGRSLWLTAHLVVRQSTGPVRQDRTGRSARKSTKRNIAKGPPTHREERHDHEDNPP